MSNASYAVLTRVKAKFGKRLTEKDYKALLDCGSISDVMAYLKSNTHYINAFGEANERGIRRGLFENLLRQYVNSEFEILSRYEHDTGEDFSQFLAHKNEVDEIVKFLTRLNSAESEEEHYNFTLPPHIAKKVKIDLNALADVVNFEEFVFAMRKSHFGSILLEYPTDIRPIPVAEIENKLYVKLCAELFEAIEKTDASEREELTDLFNTIIDYRNFTNIIRLKKYYFADGATVFKYLLPFGSIRPKVMLEMCNAESSAEVFRIMQRTRVGKLISKVEYATTGELPRIIEFRKARHNMYFSDSPVTVMMSYILLCEIELHNLICIIEGARYNIDKSKIEPLLIY